MKILRAIPLFVFLILPAIVLAQGFEFDPDGSIATTLDLSTKDAQSVVVDYVKYVRYAIALPSIIMVVYGGVRYMTSGGNEETIKQSKAILKYSMIGLALVLFSWILVDLVFKTALLA